MAQFGLSRGWTTFKERCSNIKARLTPCFRDRSGALSIQFALLLIPIVTLSGGAIDLGNIYRIRSILQNASDAAAVGAIGYNSAAYLAAESMNGNGTLDVGNTDATNIFNTNVQNLGWNATYTMTPTVTKTGVVLNATTTWTATVPMTFLAIVGQSTWTITGSSSATNTMFQYLNFYLMVDVSGSMGLPSTQNGETLLASLNPDDKSQYPGGCVFACHFSGNQGYIISRRGKYATNPSVSLCAVPDTNACIQLRTDAIAVAIQDLLQTAQSTEVVANQYQIGLYPFIAYLETYFAITPNITATGPNSLAAYAGNITTLLDTGVDANLGSGGTHFENAFPTMNSIITSVGNGSKAANPLPWVFLITDGSQNYQYQWNGSWHGSNSATTVPTSVCKTLKDRGISIAVLYIPYQQIINPTNFANSEDFYANANIPKIPPALTACASPGFFFQANTPADITNALAEMFQSAVLQARLTQ